ncbi:hypothetical protein [Streptomyces cellulosae]|uniref:hypothetical protein n=1 Tax=Streptomyces cellulosae TaxID=1968 RepID=UPI00131E6156|nr:hypothetical protein [Streptomyces cellulosae]
MKNALIPIATNMAALCLTVTMFVVADIPLSLAVACMALSIIFMVRPLRIAWATLQFTRGSSRARRFLDSSKNAGRGLDRAAADLRQCLQGVKAFLESADAGEDSAEEERKRRLAEIQRLTQLLEAARELRRSEHARASAAVNDLDRLLENVKARTTPERKYSATLANGLVGLAVFLAGPAHAYLADTWRADMIGAPEDDLVLSPQRRLAHARGLVYASVRIRAGALIQPLWRPVDWLLASSKRVDTVIAVIVGAMAIYLSRNLHELLVEASGPCALAITLLKTGAARLRRVRGVELIGREQASDRQSE